MLHARRVLALGVVIIATDCAKPATSTSTGSSAPPVAASLAAPLVSAPAPIAPAPVAPPVAVNVPASIDAGVAAAAEEEDVEEGSASFYADMLIGRRTASGEPYASNKSTCAHREYDFGTVLEVENTTTHEKVRCRVNDRGPNNEEHLIDVSKKVARALGMIGPSVVDVRVRVAADQSDPDRHPDRHSDRHSDRAQDRPKKH